MRLQTAEQTAAAIQSLYRIRATESAPDERGMRTVWHQGSSGADLLSHVDGAGHVVRQEFTLFADGFVWTSREGLRTAAVSPNLAEMRAEAATLIGSGLTAELDLARVQRANQALAAYDGMDRYILHLQHVLERVVAGFQDHEEPTITRPSALLPALVPPPPSPAASSQGRLLWALLAWLAGLGVIGALLYAR